MLQRLIDLLLRTARTRLLPALVLGVLLLLGLSVLQRTAAPQGEVLPLAVWEEDADAAPPDLQVVAQHLQAQPRRAAVDTLLSTRPFWIGISATAPQPGLPWAVALESRQAMRMECFDRHSGQALGAADRDRSHGAVKAAGAGFALHLDATQQQVDALCRADFRGPAHVAAVVWTRSALDAAIASWQTSGAVIEAGLGVLVLSMAFNAFIDRSLLYWALVGWLIVSLRMAALSQGTDFSVLGMPVAAAWLVPMRQWTACLYLLSTIGVFSLLFGRELHTLKLTWLLRLQWAGGLVALLLCAVLPFESFLPVLWALTLGLAVASLPALYKILVHMRSQPGFWYAASLLVTALIGVNAVLSVSLGLPNMLGGFNGAVGALLSALLVSVAVAARLRSDRELRERAQQRLASAYAESPVGLFSVDAAGLIVNANPAFTTMVGAGSEQAPQRLSTLFDDQVQQAFAALHGSTGVEVSELQARLQPTSTAAGDSAAERWFAIKASRSPTGRVEASLQEITERVRATRRLEFLVNHDPLTECLNLRGLRRQVARGERPVRSLAYFDLDRFKLINDLFGHAAGDAVLRQVCERMRSQLDAQDLLARVGGDEFVIAFLDAGVSEAAQRCRNICALISASPFQIEDQRFALRVSAGLVAAESFGGAALAQIISGADTLCRVAKKQPGDRLMVMEGSDSFLRHHQEVLALIAVLERGDTPPGLFLLMQPQLSLRQPFEALDFEVLLRLRKDDGQVLSGGLVVEAAEACGRSVLVDRWVLNAVITWLQENAARLPNTRSIGVNLSGASLNDEAFVVELFDLLERQRAWVGRICLEITETVALTDMTHMQRFIERARALGVQVALDDFGAGYSSFGYLKGLAVDALKLDGSLVRDAVRNPAGMAIVSALAGLTRRLGMQSVGEYAEDLATLQALVEAEVDCAQGYAISRAVAPERILAAHSAAYFIEEPAIRDFVRRLPVPGAGGAPRLRVL